jgi:hypothetical protein
MVGTAWAAGEVAPRHDPPRQPRVEALFESDEAGDRIEAIEAISPHRQFNLAISPIGLPP